MCGISGFFTPRGEIDPKLLHAMAQKMRHRGPDHTGFYSSPDRRIGLAHNRLAILDISEAGNQPMQDATGSRRIIFNGEIYNFLELRKDLQRKGHVFRSNCDTEVMLRLYEEKGIDFLEYLNGIFAFCIYDEKRRILFLARDRVGVKPLYYVVKDGNFAFASEPKALLCLPFVSRDLDIGALDAYFTIGYIPYDLCIFRDIRKLMPAHYLILDLASGNLSIDCYWNLQDHTSDLSSTPEVELTDILESILRDAIRIQKISDVPIGSFLSGGVDSSIVSTLMAEMTDEPINTFNISFDSTEHDESPYALIVAENIGSKHTETRVEMDAVSSLYHLIDNFDEPFADSSMIPTYYVSKVAKERVTVVLSGDGGDELFGGYNWYSWVLRLQHIEERFGSLSTALRWMGSKMPEGMAGQHLLASLCSDPGYQFLERTSCFQAAEKLSLYSREFSEAVRVQDFGNIFMKRFRAYDGDLIQRMTKMDFNCYLPEDILTKVDRASMAVSLEARVPWLDHRLVEFAFSLPSHFKIHKGRKKYLPKLLAKKLLPRNLPLERKKGFSIPLQQWMRGDLGIMLETLLSSKQSQNYIDCNKTSELLKTYKSDLSSKQAVKLYAILLFLLWHDKYAI